MLLRSKKADAAWTVSTSSTSLPLQEDERKITATIAVKVQKDLPALYATVRSA